MGIKFKIAVVGSGPAGLSAAARAAELGLSHVLLEAESRLSNTIFRYQRGKHVMSEPKALPLRASIRFAAGRREQILDEWDESAERLGINVRHQSKVAAISGARGNFDLMLADGTTIRAEHVVLAIGVQGNLNQLGCPGAEHERVQYQLDDPDEYHDETIVVIGVGNAGLENALALAGHNRVMIVNQFDDFRFANDVNESAIRTAMNDGSVTCHSSADVLRIDPGTRPTLVLQIDRNELHVPCDRIIARIGATPPRSFVESCGVRFATPERTALPILSESYESSVAGLYIVGALAGFPLIKQAMNQGYEVIESIEGRKIEAADNALMRARLQPMSHFTDVDAALDTICRRLPLLAALTRLQLREYMLESTLRKPKTGETIFARNDYGDTFLLILEGTIEGENSVGRKISLGAGEFFGEMSLISGRRRNATMRAGTHCVLVETPRRTALRAMHAVSEIRQQIETTFLRRTIETVIAPGLPPGSATALIQSARTQRFRTGDILFNEGDAADGLHIIAKGSVTISRQLDGRDAVLNYVPAGDFVGAMALLSNTPRAVNARASSPTETIRLDGEAFRQLIETHPALRERIAATYRDRVATNQGAAQHRERSGIVGFLMAQGLGEATDVLLIDETLCVRCDQCEKACADTHGGVSRLKREAGPSYQNLHVPTSCRHCEHPHCMKDCPPDAIKRNPKGEVYITDACIGCGNCERNCPYGVIHMGEEQHRQPSLWRWMLFGGKEPGAPSGTITTKARKPEDAGIKRAVKCDMCKDLPGGAACVRACPTGAALRASPEEFLRVAQR